MMDLVDSDDLYASVIPAEAGIQERHGTGAPARSESMCYDATNVAVDHQEAHHA